MSTCQACGTGRSCYCAYMPGAPAIKPIEQTAREYLDAANVYYTTDRTVKLPPSKEQELRDRITQLESEFQRRSWLIPDQSDPGLAHDEWWAMFVSHNELTYGALTKVAPRGMSGNSALFKVKKCP